MKTIIIGFSTNNAIGSRLISWFLRRPYSHTYFKFQEPWYSDMTVSQSTGHGIGYMCETRFNEGNTAVKEYPLQISDELFMRVVEDCHRNSGVSYGYLQDAGIFICGVLDKVGIHIKRNPLPYGINCSEWMYYILTDVYGKWTDEDPALITPADVDAFLSTKVNK